LLGPRSAPIGRPSPLYMFFSTEDLCAASNLFERVLEIPVTNDSLPFLFSGLGEELNLTILQKAIINNIQSLHKFTKLEVYYIYES